MLQRRADRNDELEQTSELAAYETGRSAAESSPEKAEPKKDEEQVSIFWRIFGGTILSIVALVTITLFNNISSSITELRAEISREREARAELVKKDEFSARTSAQYERMRGIDTVKVELEGLKEKLHSNAVAVEGVKKDTAGAADAMKKDAAALEILKERVAVLEALKKDVAALEALKEKVATATADLKAAREDIGKLSADVERNKTSDLERKAFRDAQAKQVDEAIKELQKGLQLCREKLARLEGAKPAPKDPTGGDE
jgi:DNA repair exonuclease SbcCD ATPase subunit